MRHLAKLEHGLVDDQQGDGISGVGGGDMYTKGMVMVDLGR